MQSATTRWCRKNLWAGYTGVSCVFIAVLFLILWFPNCGMVTDPRRPNILLIMTDDQGFGDLGMHGNDKIHTPVLDALASQSIQFERFFVSPLCTPTRATLMTGRYALRTGAESVTRGLETVRSEEVTIAEVLKSAGYATGCFGKWHIGEHYPSHPNGQGFDEFYGIPQGHSNLYFDPTLDHNGQAVETHGYITDVLTDAALQFLEQHRAESFFCYVPYNAPHSPFQVPDRYFDRYTALGFDARTASVYGMVENIDDNIGRLLAKLDELNLAGHTVVLFLTDNGPEGRDGSRYNAGMRGMKGSVHEGGMRVPMFIRWPGRFTPGAVIDRIAAHIDLLPTIAELCGITELTTLPLDGRSLVPLLDGSETDWPDRMLFERSTGWRQMVDYRDSVITDLPPFSGTVRTQRWRAVNEGKGWQLYDMREDPLQQKDATTVYPDTLGRLSNAYIRWFADVTQTPIVRPHIPVGYRQRPMVELPAPEAYFTGGIRWYNRWGFAHDWLTGWTSPNDRIWWNIEVMEAGDYEVSMACTCPPGALGARIRVEAGDSVIEGDVDSVYDPEPRNRPDRTSGNWAVQTFARQRLGTFGLKRGKHRITIQTLAETTGPGCDLKSLWLRRVDQ